MKRITPGPVQGHTLTIEYSNELLWALQQDPDQFAVEARVLLAIKLYESGRLSTGLAAQLAGVPRSTFYFLLSQHGISPFGHDPDELVHDLVNARRVNYTQKVDKIP